MDVILSWLSVSFSASAIVLLIILLFFTTSYKRAIKEVEQTVREEFRSNRDESARAARDLREEVFSAQRSSIETMIQTIGELGNLQRDKLGSIERRIKELTESNEVRNRETSQYSRSTANILCGKPMKRNWIRCDRPSMRSSKTHTRKAACRVFQDCQ